MKERVVFGVTMSDPQDSTGAPKIDPEAEVQRLAEQGRQRTEREAQIKANIKQDKEFEAEKGQAAVEIVAEKKEAEKEKKKTYRVTAKTREQELAADKVRREKESANILAEQKKREAKRKKEQGYMGELHEAAQIKQAMELKERQANDEADRERTKAEYEHRAAVEEADRVLLRARQDADREAASRKILADNDARAKLYEVERWHRTSLQKLDLDAHSQGKKPVTTGPSASQPRKKKVDADATEKKRIIEFEKARTCTVIENEMHAKKTQADAAYRSAVHAADQALARHQEEINLALKKKLLDKFMG